MITLRGATWDHPRGVGGLSAAARELAVLHPDVRVEWTARTLQQFADQPLEELVEDHDLVVVDHPHVPAAARAGLLLPLDGTGHDDEIAVLASQSVGASHTSYVHDGRQWALALDAATQVSVHRPDLLPDPPRDWGAVLELARAGRVLWPAKPVDAVSSLLTLAAGAGRPVGTGPGRFLDEEVGRDVLRRLADLAALVPSWCLAANPIEVADRLSTGDEFWCCPLLYGYANYSREGFRPHRLAYRDAPAGPRGVDGANLGGAGIAVSARTRHPVEAVVHAFALASADVQRGSYFDGGGQPANAVAWDDDRLDAATLGFFRGTRATLEGSSVRPRTTGWIAVQSAVGDLVTAFLRGDLDVERCLQEIERAAAGEGDHP